MLRTAALRASQVSTVLAVFSASRPWLPACEIWSAEWCGDTKISMTPVYDLQLPAEA
jgi:hypothetical protein